MDVVGGFEVKNVVHCKGESSDALWRECKGVWVIVLGVGDCGNRGVR